MHVINKTRNNRIANDEKDDEPVKTQDNKCTLNRPPSNKTKNINKTRFDKLYLDSKDREKKYIQLNNQIEKEKLKECTFEPNTNAKRSFLRSKTPRCYIKEDKNTFDGITTNNKRYISNSPKKMPTNSKDKSIKLSTNKIDSNNNKISKIECDTNKINQDNLNDNSVETTPIS